ncbi:hypothetical protein [Fimbriiglobus ruber]|uniref:Uncharacterized protein n=1 Tax=Fimbriiglobus ruber TaxID=1908690 RepID=A0A225DVB3_9BACT|nr:hypothetical protein [Fimbriiglobus ruber]OWK42468.1 hypothetical protein FRUB_04546 [Fimbriiglobus ruber]
MAKLLLAEVQYNNSFFRNGTISDFFADIMRTSLAKIQEILTPSSPPSSTPNSPPSTN